MSRGPRLVLVRVGVGVQDAHHVDARPARRRGLKSAKLRRARDDLGAPEPLELPQPGDREQSRAPPPRRERAAAPARARRRPARRRPGQQRRSLRPAECCVSTDSHRPSDAFGGDERDAGRPPGHEPPVDQARGRGRDHEQGAHQQPADRVERGDGREGEQPEQHRSGTTSARRARRALAVEAARQPAVAQDAATARAPPALQHPPAARSPVPIRSRLPNSRLSTWAPESKTSEARIAPAARQPTSATATTESCSPRRRRPRASRRARRARGPERAERRREAEAVGDAQGPERPRCRPHGRKKPGPAARSRFRAPGRRREQQHLEHAALYERKRKGSGIAAK